MMRRVSATVAIYSVVVAILFHLLHLRWLAEFCGSVTFVALAVAVVAPNRLSSFAPSPEQRSSPADPAASTLRHND